MSNTLLLDVVAWDLVLDVTGNIAVASDPYSLGQDAASEAKLFQGELYYDTTRGIPYFQMFLGRAPSLAMLKAKIAAAAKLVPGVVASRCYISGVKSRGVTGQVQVTNKAGVITGAEF